MMDNKLILILCFLIILITNSSSEIFPPITESVIVGTDTTSEQTGVNIFIPEAILNTSTISVNISDFWSTNLGFLGNVNATQFDNNGGTLTIDVGWLELETNNNFLRLDGSNSPTAAYSWTTDLVTTAFVRVGTFRSDSTASDVGALWITGTDNLLSVDSELIWDVSNGRLGVLQVSPQFTLDVAGTGNFDDSVNINTDSGSLFFGAAQDSSINYNGTDLVFDSQDGGSGNYFFNGGVADFQNNVTVNGFLRVIEDGVALDVQNTVDSNNIQSAIFRGGDRATPTDSDIFYISYALDDSNGDSVEYFRESFMARDVSSNSKDGRYFLDIMTANVLRNLIFVSGNFIVYNEEGRDVDFIVETDNNNGMIFTNGALDVITFGSRVQIFAMTGVNGFSDEIQFKVQGHSTQTNNLAVFENSAGTDLIVIDGSGNFNVDSDTLSLFVGASQDASVTYNGTDMVLNPREVGNGHGYLLDDWHITGDISIGGNLTTDDGSFLSSNATCTFLSSPDGSTVLEVCNV